MVVLLGGGVGSRGDVAGGGDLTVKGGGEGRVLPSKTRRAVGEGGEGRMGVVGLDGGGEGTEGKRADRGLGEGGEGGRGGGGGSRGCEWGSVVVCWGV